MKRIVCMILLLLLFLPGCDPQEEVFAEPVDFYYMKADVAYFSAEGVIARETREAEGYRQNYEYLLGLYLQGPENQELKQLFPQYVKLVELEISDRVATVTFNDTFARLTGLDLTIACACLTATVCDMTGVQSVTIQTENRLLDGNKSITMTWENILLLDSNAANLINN
ncbi:MAG: hypothetical protein E7448_02820 [Ruminococcaceae bacterium]|nr:hypothetical protein [Oscillospiraceae bacterium]